MQKLEKNFQPAILHVIIGLSSNIHVYQEGLTNIHKAFPIFKRLFQYLEDLTNVLEKFIPLTLGKDRRHAVMGELFPHFITGGIDRHVFRDEVLQQLLRLRTELRPLGLK